MFLFIATVLIVGVTIAEIIVANELKTIDKELVKELQAQNQLLREQNTYLFALADISVENDGK